MSMLFSEVRRADFRLSFLIRVFVITLVFLFESASLAGGFFLPAHGTRGIGRAGALIAGADDAGGIWYNPASMSRLDRIQLLVDAALVFQALDYTRVDSGGNALSAVSNQGPLLPIPTIALAGKLSDRFWIGGSFTGPTAAIQKYPEPNYRACADLETPMNCLATVQRDAPQRYTLISMEGTLFATMEFAVAVRLHPTLVVGASLNNTFATIGMRKSVSGFTGIVGAPEDPEFDALTQTKMIDLFNPSGRLGLLYQPYERLRIGASFKFPTLVRGSSTNEIHLPVAEVFDSTTLDGDKADVAFDLPMEAAIGVEVAWWPQFKTELSVVWENWRAMREIRFTPTDIVVNDVPSIGRVEVGDVVETLGFHDTISIRVGGDYLFQRVPLALRLGYGFESAAVPHAYTSVLAFSPEKHFVGVGASYAFGSYRLEAGYALILSPTHVVDYKESLALQKNPISPSDEVAVGGGTYRGRYQLLSIGLIKTFQ